MSRSETVRSNSLVKPDSSIKQDALDCYRVFRLNLRKMICDFKLVALTAVTVGLSGNVLGEGTVSVGATPAAAARVKLEVVIPKLVALQVGSSTDTVDTLTCKSTIEIGGNEITLTNQEWDGITDPETTTPLPDGVASSPDISIIGGTRWRAQINVYALGGAVTITSAASNGDFLQSSAGDQIALNSIGVASAGAVSHPSSLNGGSTTISQNGNGIVNKSGSWTYNLTTSSTLAAGTYESTITYTATIL